MAFAIECYENGIIGKTETDGIEMTWGNDKSIIAMLEKLVRREGFGNVLADGVKTAAETIGRGADQYAMHVRGQEPGAHDPKFNMAWGISYRLDATPGRHTQGGEGPHCPGVMPEYDPKSVAGRGMIHKRGACVSHVMNCVGMCMFVWACLPHADVFIEFLNAISGWNLDMAEVVKIGERIANIRQAFNSREGIAAPRFKMPDRLVGSPPQGEGPLAGITIDEEGLGREFSSGHGLGH